MVSAQMLTTPSSKAILLSAQAKLVFSRMIGVGEKTGSLEETLIYLGNFYESELNRSLKTFSTVFEPFLLLAVGIVIGFVAVAIISPIYEVTRGLHP